MIDADAPSCASARTSDCSGRADGQRNSLLPQRRPGPGIASTARTPRFRTPRLVVLRVDLQQFQIDLLPLRILCQRVLEDSSPARRGRRRGRHSASAIGSTRPVSCCRGLRAESRASELSPVLRTRRRSTRRRVGLDVVPEMILSSNLVVLRRRDAISAAMRTRMTRRATAVAHAGRPR